MRDTNFGPRPAPRAPLARPTTTSAAPAPPAAAPTRATNTPPTDITDYMIDLPAVPMVAVKVMQLVDDPDTSSQTLARTIASDQAIAFKVLQMANSAYYGQGRQILTLSQAVTVLGQRTIRSLVLLYSIPASLQRGGKTGPEEKALWEHAVGTALAARLLGKATGGLDPEAMFAAGLLHDIGKSILLIKAPAGMAEVLYAAWPPGGNTGKEIEKSRFGFDHEEIGGRLLDEWQMPALFVAAARWHHAPALAGEQHRAVRVITVANRIAHHLGFGGPADPVAWSDVLALAEPLGLHAGQLETIAVETVNQLTAERSLYDL